MKYFYTQMYYVLSSFRMLNIWHRLFNFDDILWCQKNINQENIKPKKMEFCDTNVYIYIYALTGAVEITSQNCIIKKHWKYHVSWSMLVVNVPQTSHHNFWCNAEMNFGHPWALQKASFVTLFCTLHVQCTKIKLKITAITVEMPHQNCFGFF